MAGITGPMAMTVWTSTTTTCSGNGAGSHITQLGNLQLDSGTRVCDMNGTIRVVSFLVACILEY